MERRETVPATMEKQGSLLGLLGLGTAVHVAPNIGMKAIKSTERGHRMLTNTFAAGLEHGRTGQQLHHNLNSLLTYGVGPESMVEYRMGRKLGQKIAHYPEEIQQKFMATMQRNLESRFNHLPESKRQEFLNTPLIGTAKRYFDGEGEGKVKDFLVRRGIPAEQGKTKLNHIGDAAMLGGAAAVEPHLLLQPTVSMIRKKTAESEFGRRFLKRQFEKGEEGLPLNKVKEFASDMLISPGALDPYRIGRTLNRNFEPADRQRLKAIGGELFEASKKTAPPVAPVTPENQAKAILGNVDVGSLKQRLKQIEGGTFDKIDLPPSKQG